MLGLVVDSGLVVGFYVFYLIGWGEAGTNGTFGFVSGYFIGWGGDGWLGWAGWTGWVDEVESGLTTGGALF